jgi:hypothetical protein
MTASLQTLRKLLSGKEKKDEKRQKCFDSIRRIIFTVFIAGLPDGLFSNQKYKFG